MKRSPVTTSVPFCAQLGPWSGRFSDGLATEHHLQVFCQADTMSGG